MCVYVCVVLRHTHACGCIFELQFQLHCSKNKKRMRFFAYAAVKLIRQRVRKGLGGVAAAKRGVLEVGKGACPHKGVPA